MFGIINPNYYILYILFGVIAILIIGALIIFNSKINNGDIDEDQFFPIFMSLGVIACCIIVALYIIGSVYIQKTSSIQSNNNIKIAISDNYNDAENIIIKENDKEGYFSSGNKNYNFEVIDNTLVIKNGETVIKYISGDNY
jgi:hypothetical protein